MFDVGHTIKMTDMDSRLIGLQLKCIIGLARWSVRLSALLRFLYVSFCDRVPSVFGRGILVPYIKVVIYMKAVLEMSQSVGAGTTTQHLLMV